MLSIPIALVEFRPCKDLNTSSTEKSISEMLIESEWDGKQSSDTVGGMTDGLNTEWKNLLKIVATPRLLDSYSDSK